MDLLKAPYFPYQKRLHKKGHLNLANEVLEGFGLFNRPFVTHSKNSNSGNLELKSELIIFQFLKVTLKTIVVNSDSWRKA